jgi:lysophospholipase L1-like esterase
MKNRIAESFYIVATAIIILFLTSFIPTEKEIAPNFILRNIDIFSDIRNVEENDELINYLPELNLSKASILGGLNLPIFDGFSDVFYDASTPYFQGRKSPIVGNKKQLSFFFEALKSAKTKTVRVAHYGDSAIEGDLVTADIRETLQKRFGGTGVGWLGIVSQDITFRMTTKHSFSDNWDAAALYSSNPKNFRLGISGEVSIPKGNSWVQYEATRARSYLNGFTNVKVYYSNAKNSQLSYSFNGGTAQRIGLKSEAGLQELVVTNNAKAKSVKLEFPLAQQAEVYGVSLENEAGVYVDNLPLRGNSGVDLGSLQVSMLKDFSKYLDYKLIILEFGLNIAGTRTDYSWYEREMIKVINNFKSAFPKSSIILVSVHDKAMKKGNSFVTDPAILQLHAVQKTIAEKADVAFWSLFDAMGGENSMATWVSANPPLAFKDYIHFNEQGAKKVAQLFTEALLDEFAKFK